MAPKKPRLSLTKAQIQAGVGAELLALCESITEDGSLSAAEILALRDWLETHKSSDLPSISFLASTLEQILADGKVTKEERKELYQAIETVLPPEARKDAADKRRAVETQEKQVAREHRETEKQLGREERERQRPLYRANFMVAGVHYEGRGDVIEEHVNDGDTVFLARDPENRFSKSAVEIRLENGLQIGFLPEEHAVDVVPFSIKGAHTPHT